MIDRRIVRRYAAALYNQAMASDVVDMVESDLGLITYTFESNPRLDGAVTSPMIPATTKRDIVSGVFRGKIHEITLHYLYLLIDNRREEAVKHTEAEYILLANDARGVVSAQVTSAVALTESETAKLKAKLSEITGKRVEIALTFDPRIIGGLVVRIGDTVMDGSIVGHLERLKAEFLGRQ